MRNITELLLKIIAKDYIQSFDVKQIFTMLWDVGINTVDDLNDDDKITTQKVNLVLYLLKIFINALNEYHRTGNTCVAIEFVKYVWSQTKNVLDNEDAPVRNQKIVQLVLYMLPDMLKDGDIANFANENLKDVLSLAIRVLALNFWLTPQLDLEISENNWTVQKVLEVLLELLQMGKEQSKQINNEIKKFGLVIENDTIIIKDKNVFDNFYGDKSERISETISFVNKEHIENKEQRDNKEIENDQTNENKIGDETEDLKIENKNEQKDMNKTQPNSLRTEAKVDKEKVERTQEEEKVEDTKKLLIPIRKTRKRITAQHIQTIKFLKKLRMLIAKTEKSIIIYR